MADSTVALPIVDAYAPSMDGAAVESERDGESALVEDLRAGDQDAYEMLIERYEQPVFSIVSRVMDDPEDAADVTQEVFLKVFRNIDAFRGDSTLKTWIYRIAVNEAHNQLRWFGRHRRQEVALESEAGHKGVGDLVADRGPSPYDMARDHETQRLLESALKRISVHYRAALVLREVEGLRYEEVAEILEISLGTVKSRILRGREALRKVLAGQLERTPVFELKAERGRFSPFPGRECAEAVETRASRSPGASRVPRPSPARLRGACSLEGSEV